MRRLIALALALFIAAGAGAAQAQAAPGRPALFSNPIIPGFAPDPSIVRVGPDYYLVTSTFEYFPAIPVYHSRDLVNWSLIGHALADPVTAGLSAVESSGGVQAATIRHHAGLFYVVTTSVVEGRPVSFIVTAQDPKGPWSPPRVVADAVGIDPSLFFDDDGRAWYTANWMPPDPQFPGQTEIWLQQLDLATLSLTGPRHFIWRGCCQGEWAEAPHLFKKDGRYVLVIAEGGTSYEHAVSVAVAPAVTGPYRNNPRNPVLTHRHLGYDHPITSVGHADLVELPDGRWYAVVLGMRRLQGLHPTLGRETFLVPVAWERAREWWKTDPQTFPVFSPGTGKVEARAPMPLAGTRQRPVTRFHDDFGPARLHPEWTFRRSHDEPFHSLAARPGHLRLRLQPGAVAEKARYSFPGIRQRHFRFRASVRLAFQAEAQEEAGLLVIQKDTAAWALTLARGATGQGLLRLSHFGDAGPEPIAETPFAGTRPFLRVTGQDLAYTFEFSADGRRWTRIGPALDGTQLSPAVLKGFNYTGVFVGLYASSNGRPTRAHADFSRFRYDADAPPPGR